MFFSQAHQDVVNSKIEIYLQSCIKLYYVHRNHEIQYVDKVDIFIPMRGRALLLIKSCRIHTYNSTLA